MDAMLDIPKDRKRQSAPRLCLIMGLTALLFILAANRLGAAQAL